MKTIPTKYNGIKYRSRTESRWAVFFDACRVPVVYEPEGFEDSGKTYLPDFELAANHHFVAIKPLHDFIEQTDAWKRELFWQQDMFGNGLFLWIIAGIPAPDKYRIFPPDMPQFGNVFKFFDCRRCKKGLCFSDGQGTFGDFSGHSCQDHHQEPTENKRVGLAMYRAMIQKFGERKAP